MSNPLANIPTAEADVPRPGRFNIGSGYTGGGVAATPFGANVMRDLLCGGQTDRTLDRVGLGFDS